MEEDRTRDAAGPRNPEGHGREDPFGDVDPVRDGGPRPGPTWRGLVIAVIAAVVLSVGATLLLGGGYGFARQGAASGCGTGGAGDCCPPSQNR